MRKPSVLIGAVIVLPLADRQKFQAQIERQIQYQSFPVWFMRIATGPGLIDQAIASAKEAGAEFVLVFDGLGYYSHDYVETQLKKWIGEGRPQDFTPYKPHVYYLPKGVIYDGGSPYPIAMSFTSTSQSGKASNWALSEVARTELNFFKFAYGI